MSPAERDGTTAAAEPADEAPALLVERAAARTGLDRLAAALGRPDDGAYLVPVVGWVLDVVVLSGISYLTVGREQFESPYLLIIPVGLCAGVLLARWLRRRYTGAVDSLPGDEVDADSLRSVPAGRVPVAVLAVFFVANLVQLALSPAEVAAFVELHGPAVAYAKYLLVAPFYFVVFADVVALLGAGMVLLPWRLYNTDLTLDFSDVTGFAGLYEVSRLLRAGTLTYFVGLTAWTVFLLVPSILGSSSDVSTADSLVFPLLWLFGLALYATPVLVLHRHMSREKTRHIRDIDEKIRALDPQDDGRGIPYLDPSDDDRPELQQRFIELQQVRSAREYPVSVAIVEELVVAALVPVAIQWALSNLLPV